MNPFQALLSSTVNIKEVFFFGIPQVANSSPHFFVCIKKSENEILIFTCCTTQFQKREQYVMNAGLSGDTLVEIEPTSQNGLKKRTLVDCNKYFPITVEDFKKLVDTKKAEYRGEVSGEIYNKILTGIHASDEISEEQKEEIPKPS
jgi:hypothetical protein